jgi:hypothetical protein
LRGVVGGEGKDGGVGSEAGVWVVGGRWLEELGLTLALQYWLRAWQYRYSNSFIRQAKYIHTLLRPINSAKDAKMNPLCTAKC